QFARYCELRADGRVDEAAVVLKQIADYNHYDCISTRNLRDWLINRAIECGVLPLGAQPVADGGAVEHDDQLAIRLAAFIGDPGHGRTAEQTAVALIAAARGYHRREDKPFWWAHFDRLNNPVDEWADGNDVFVADSAEVVRDWHRPSTRARKQQRRVKLTGTLASGELRGSVFALYESPAPTGLTDNPDRRAAGNAEIIAVDDPAVPTEVIVCEREPTAAGTFAQLPFALTPGRPLPTGTLRESIQTAAADIAADLPAFPNNAISDILLRRPPRTHRGASLPRTGETVTDITAALLALDSSYLAVHGPPGTGKTFTAAKIIARLVNDQHWRIGVVAQSHAVVENLFRDLVKAEVEPARIGKKDCAAGVPWQVLDADAYATFVAEFAGAGEGCVIGGTAWDFANHSRVHDRSLELLVIEEAGQFCLANTIAVARSAANLLLVGDPQQLPQVSQGRHPEPVDVSALGWLVEDHRTLPEDRGYFLKRSYRMHPAVCAAVSRLCYDDRLTSDETLTAARRLDGCAPGVHALTVAHDGNSTSSPEEAAAIATEIRRMLGATWTDEHGSRPLGQDDVLVVAPYNAQVLCVRDHLDAAGLAGVGVGTVDKFQGRQAPVVFISMTASSIDDVPRGISFLLNRNRLNVAVSRAKFASVIVRSPLLTEYLPVTPAGLIDLGAFLSLSSFETPR
ncbi:MAG: AAA family ATPase, partial [Mycobacteriaceae bacterium]|nr:AAA family ATPase [Mycobacteriaceae bacterium]